MASLRLDKYLADSGIGSRSDVKKYIKAGRVLVNGCVSREGSIKINSDTDRVMFDDSYVNYSDFSYYILNKPAGCVSATKDSLSDTVISYLKGVNTKGLFPVGRLDKDTEGLLFITNDGPLAHSLLSPRKHVDKVYLARTDRKLTEGEMEEFRAGLDIGDDKITLPAGIEYDDTEEGYYVTLNEGRFHQVKRMFEHFRSKVVYLKRISFGPLKLDSNLKAGEFRPLNEKEIDLLKGGKL